MINITSQKVFYLAAALLSLIFFWSLLSVREAYSSIIDRTSRKFSLSKSLHGVVQYDPTPEAGVSTAYNTPSHESQNHAPVAESWEVAYDESGGDDQPHHSASKTLSHTSTRFTPVLNAPSRTKVGTQATPLILYAYSDSSWAYRNLEFFLTHGLHESATFVFILNGATSIPTTATDMSASPEPNATESPAYAIPESIIQAQRLLDTYSQTHANVHVISRTNTCYDLGAYGDVLLSNHSHYLQQHKKFIMLNASIRGPLVPLWSRDCWSDAYLHPVISGMKDAQDRKVKLVGMTMNCVQGRPRHLQSMIMATDDIGMRILLGLDPEVSLHNQTLLDQSLSRKRVGLSKCAQTYQDAVDDVETQLTPLIKDYTNSVTHEKYTVLPFFALGWSATDYVDTCTNGDVNAVAGAYEGGNLHFWETMFIKTRWGVERDEVERTSAWLDAAVEKGLRKGSWEVCRKRV